MNVPGTASRSWKLAGPGTGRPRRDRATLTLEPRSILRTPPTRGRSFALVVGTVDGGETPRSAPLTMITCQETCRLTGQQTGHCPTCTMLLSLYNHVPATY